MTTMAAICLVVGVNVAAIMKNTIATKDNIIPLTKKRIYFFSSDCANTTAKNKIKPKHMKLNPRSRLTMLSSMTIQ